MSAAAVSALEKSQPGPSHRCKSAREDCNSQQGHQTSDPGDGSNEQPKKQAKSSSVSESASEKITTTRQVATDKMSSNSTEKPTTIRKSSTTTVSKFKEKRPEPLKLNPNLNQDIPLDLSVKSAGNVPSGALSNIFNLGPTSQLTTLETPRIQWQDNDALLAAGKNRLFSSSTNASQRARISSLVGDSPPITPNTPLVLESPSTFESRKAQILDRWAQTSKPQINHLRNEFMNGHRRSCSSDNLNIGTPHDKSKLIPDDAIRGIANGFSNLSKKNAISPLAIKSLSTTQNSNGPQNKFSYTNQQIASNLSESPTGNSHSNGKSLTPTSVSNATANLLNIHLNSPTGLSQSPITPNPCKSPSFSSFEQEFSILDPLISGSFGQQQQQQGSRNSSVNFSSPSLNNDLNNNSHRNASSYQQPNLGSVSSSATLNTPTLISPSQLKAGHLCFLQSPTLSPMSSVFDLPSPFLMFPHSAQSQQQSKQFSPKIAGSQATDRGGSSDMQVDIQCGTGSNVSKSRDASLISSSASAETRPNRSIDVSSLKDLSQLITSGTEKISTPAPKVEADEDTNMECDLEDDEQTRSVNVETQPVRPLNSRPATAIPQICVSDHQLEGIDRSSARSNNQDVSKRAFCTQVSNYRSERLESSSAPPEVYQRRVRSKIKAIGADSCINITDKLQNEVPNSSHQQSKAGRPYPQIRDWFPSASQLLHTQEYANGSGTTALGARSNSAEPAVYSGLPFRKTGIYSSSVINSNSTAANCYQSAAQYNSGAALSSSAQQLHYNSAANAIRLKETSSFNQTIGTGLNCSNINSINPNQQLHQYSSSDACLQQQQHNQQHSSSAGELSKISGGAPDQRPAIIPSNNQFVGSLQSVRRFHQPEASQFEFMRQNSQSNQQAISSSLNRVDYLLGDSHNQFREDQRRHMAGNLMDTDQTPMMRHLNNQASVINLLCNNETCQRQMSYANNLPGGSLTKSLTTHQHQQHQQPHGFMAGEMLQSNHKKMSNNNINGSYQIDIESRSDSRSSSSLDFSCQFLDGGSRANSEASSNMTSKKYHCDQCSKSFTRSDMLTRHKRLHSGDRPFQCSECKQEFSRSDHLSTHMRTHTGEKPYKCKLCSYSACRKDMITRHLKVHSRNPNSNDFV